MIKLAEESKEKLNKELQLIPEELKNQQEEEITFLNKVMTSVAVAAVVGGVTAVLTKNRRSSMIGGLGAMVLSFLIQ